MKQIYNLLFLCASIASMLLLQSCEKFGEPACSDTKIINQNISASHLSKVPYTGFDTLYFLNKQGDTCIVRGTGKQYGTEVEIPAGDPACYPEEKYINQFYTIQFVALKGNLDFTLTQKRFPQRIYIDRSTYNVVFDHTSSSLGLKNLTDPYYIDTITINNVLYERNNLFLTVVRNKVQVFDSTYKLIYNIPFGILYIKSEKQNEEFSIIPKP